MSAEQGWPQQQPPQGPYQQGPQAPYGDYPMDPRFAHQPEPPLRPGEEQGWGVALHLGRFLLGGFGLSIIVPLVIWLIFRRRSRLIQDHGRSALNWEITLIIFTIVWVGGLVAAMIVIGVTSTASGTGPGAGPGAGFFVAYGGIWLGLLGIGLVNLILSIVGSVRAYQRRRFHYWAIPFIRDSRS